MSTPSTQKRKVPKRGGDALSQNLTGLAVPFAFMLAKQGLEYLKKDNKKPTSSAKGVKGKKKSGVKGKKRVMRGGEVPGLGALKRTVGLSPVTTQQDKDKLINEYEAKIAELAKEAAEKRKASLNVGAQIITQNTQNNGKREKLDQQINALKDKKKALNSKSEQDRINELEDQAKSIENTMAQYRKLLEETRKVKIEEDKTKLGAQQTPGVAPVGSTPPAPPASPPTTGGKRRSLRKRH